MKLITIFFMMLAFSNQLFASLLVTPTRVVIEERDRTAEVVLLNTSNETKNYRVEWVNQAQGALGQYVKLTGKELEAFPTADGFIRFSPRRVTLAPGESQTIKLMARRKPNMKEAEYRSHLKFTALPSQDSSNLGDAGSAPDGVNIKLNLLLSYSIPVMLRTQAPSADINFDDLSLETRSDGKEVLTFSMNKQASNSVYGDFVVVHKLNGNEQEVGYLNGVNMFAEREKVMTNIVFIKNVAEKGGVIKIKFKGRGEFTDSLYGEASFQI